MTEIILIGYDRKGEPHVVPHKGDAKKAYVSMVSGTLPVPEGIESLSGCLVDNSRIYPKRPVIKTIKPKTETKGTK